MIGALPALISRHPSLALYGEGRLDAVGGAYIITPSTGVSLCPSELTPMKAAFNASEPSRGSMHQRRKRNPAAREIDHPGPALQSGTKAECPCGLQSLFDLTRGQLPRIGLPWDVPSLTQR